MPKVRIPNITPRAYQLDAFDYWDTEGTANRAVEVWSRRMGKDICYMSIAAMKSLDRKGLYLHFMPEFAHARRTLWDGFTNEGEKLIDVAFPHGMRASTNEQEMRIEFTNGSAWQLGGSDQYNRWVGGNPCFIVYSEFALANPRGWELMRPILKMNGGSAAFISTPRGYNHMYTMLELAKTEPGWRYSHQNAVDVGLMTMEDIAEEIRLGMPEELARQEYLCDFSAANVGAILGRYVEAADKSGRLCTGVWDPAGERIDVSADIGFRDTAAFWFWQPWYDGFGLVEYDEDNGLDAQEWIERLRTKPWAYGTIYLPHDAKAKTFATRHSVIEQFLAAKNDGRLDCENIKIVPQVHTQDRINAARTVLPACRFEHAACAPGLLAMREWSYKWDEDRRTYSKEPDHTWASHGSDAFTYGALMMRQRMHPEKPKPPPPLVAASTFSLEKLWLDRERFGQRNRLP